MGDLSTALGTPAPPDFDALNDQERAALAVAVDRAARERSALIDRAIDDSLRYLPALLRGAVKRALGM
jgi:hypothetical protein